MRKTLLLIATLAAIAAQQTAFAAPPKTMDGRLVDDQGRTLYTFDKDTTPGKSACSGGCANAWPAAMADSGDQASGDWSTIDGADGKKQWAYKGKPLYRFAKDEKPGDMKGDGFKDVWHTAKP